MNMRPRLRVNGDSVRARLREIVEERIDRRNHEVHVKWPSCVRLQGLHHLRPDRNIWNEVTIHDIDMDEIRACLLYRFDLGREARKIRGTESIARFEPSWTSFPPYKVNSIRKEKAGRRCLDSAITRTGTHTSLDW